MNLEFIPVKTRIVNPPKDEIWDIIDGLKIEDGDIIFITSKILSIHQGRTIKITPELSKNELAKSEAERFLEYHNEKENFHANLTITDGNLILSAGIDASNAADHYILWPKNVDDLCKEIREHIIKKTGVKNLGIVVTDSHSSPLRLGVTGFTIGLSGVEPLSDIRGEKDLFGRELHITRVNEIDPLTSMAVLLMGESSECTPIVILRNYKKIKFNKDASMKDIKVSPEQDIYAPLLKII
ncbi:coenzyme F420-0:L-glutamate ligase [Candidatus Saccharibacteria bacterium]|nr:coenzyme F420-0:L-glutamate ligase [Candidatus Saccharibacteria bacterium]